MTPVKGGLGRGLDALFADNSVEEISTTSAVKLGIMEIEPDPNQPRRDFDDAALGELADSIASQGILQPLLVRPIAGGGYRIVAGERRWRAARLAGLNEVPVVIREMNDEEAYAAMLVENLQRENLNPIEEARGYQKLIDTVGATQEQIAAKLGKSRPAVANALRLLTLPDEITAMVLSGGISAGHARALLAFPQGEVMLEAARLVMKKGLSVRETEKLAASFMRGGGKKAKNRRDSYYDEVELALSNVLGRKIRVVASRTRQSGRIELPFFDREDLMKLASALKVLEE